MPSLSAGNRGVRCASLLGLLLCLCLAQGHAAETEGVDRGGSFTLSPGLLLPAGALATQMDPGGIWNLDFDVGFSPAWSVIFGAGYSDLGNSVNHDARLMLVPAWFGLKSKAQIKPAIELYWSLAAEMTYEKAYLTGNTGGGSLENLDGGGAAAAGFDLWLTKWLLAGVDFKAHFIIEGSDVYPLMELGLRLGIRG
jgi:hypothetical protein